MHVHLAIHYVCDKKCLIPYLAHTDLMLYYDIKLDLSLGL